MVGGAQLSKEIAVEVVNKIGVLADMSRVLTEEGINIEAAAGYAAENNTAKIMLVTEDSLRALEALKKAGYKQVKESQILMLDLENKPGALKYITANLASESIDIKYIYGTACASGCPSRIILSTSDNQKALLIFKK